MHSITRTRAARRAPGRPLISSIAAEFPAAKQTHKLAPMLCSLWLRDLRGYLRTFDLNSRRVSVTPDPHEALCLPEDDAEQIGQGIIDAIGYRVELRPYRPASVVFGR